MEEQIRPKDKVGGSSPSRGTTKVLVMGTNCPIMLQYSQSDAFLCSGLHALRLHFDPGRRRRLSAADAHRAPVKGAERLGLLSNGSSGMIYHFRQV